MMIWGLGAGALAAVPSALLAQTSRENRPAVQAAGSAIETAAEADTATTVVVIGSRRQQPRSSTGTPVPVDVVSGALLVSTGQTDLSQMLNFVAPSFNSARQTIANGTDHIDPATLVRTRPWCC
jgi:iron complex outermembrane receptor protein